MQYEFFSNRRRTVRTGYPERSEDISETFQIDIAGDDIVLRTYPSGNMYKGALADSSGTSSLYICTDGYSVISIQVVSGRVINVGISNIIGDELISTCVYEQVIDYDWVCDILNSHIIDRTSRKIATRKDRGLKPQILGLPDYSRPFIRLEYSEKLDKFNSYYLDWLRYHTIGKDSELKVLLRVLHDMQDTNILDSVMRTDRMQCLGIALSLCELADRLAIHPELQMQTGYMSRLLELAFFAITIYLACYQNQDPLVDSELFAIRAKFSTLCSKSMPTVLMRCGIVNMAYLNDMYVANMYLAARACPNEMKIHYHQNALMMHQNQTVEYVTEDHMDEGFLESVNLGIGCINSMLKAMSELFMQGQMSFTREEYADIDRLFNKIIAKSEEEPSLNQVKAFCIIYQIEKYSADKPSSLPPAGFTKSKLSVFLENINADSNVAVKHTDDGNSMIQLWNRKDCNVESDILWINVIFNDDEDIRAVGINCFGHGYELKKEIDRTHLFHGFLCQTSLCRFEISPQSMMLLPYLENDF